MPSFWPFPPFSSPTCSSFTPALVGRGDTSSIISAALSGLLGSVVLGAGLSGWFFSPAGLLKRILLSGAGIAPDFTGPNK
ncbi:hypothetical protein MASR2M17_14440 [Aminivibrio sp.]